VSTKAEIILTTALEDVVKTNTWCVGPLVKAELERWWICVGTGGFNTTEVRGKSLPSWY